MAVFPRIYDIHYLVNEYVRKSINMLSTNKLYMTYKSGLKLMDGIFAVIMTFSFRYHRPTINPYYYSIDCTASEI